MIAYVSVLALFFVSLCSGQVTSWTGGGGGSNNTFANPLNWDNGVPNENSWVYINDTTCNGCYIIVDENMVVAGLFLGATASTGPYLQIAGVNLTVTHAFTLGSSVAANYYFTSVEIQKGGVLELGASCVGTIYYTGSTPITSSYNENNWFVNRGAISVLGNGGLTAGSEYILYIGTSSSNPLFIESYGSWNVTSGANVQLEFYEIAQFNIYGGSFWGSWVGTAGSPVPSIEWYGVDVVFQNGAGGDASGAGAVTFNGVVEFDSYYTQGFTGTYSSPPPNALIFNTTGVTVSNALFSGVNIVFLHDGWIADSNFTSNTLVNSSSTVSGVHAYLVGSIWCDNSGVAGIGTDFTVEVEAGATLTMTSDFALLGSVTLINNGTWIFKSNSDLYFDAAAYWVNLGLLQVVTYSNDYIRGSTFDQTTVTDVGTVVNMGTIEFSSGGGLNFEYNTGTFLQCANGVLKYSFDGTTTPGTQNYPPTIKLDGYVGLAIATGYTIPTYGVTVFSWVPKDVTAIPSGDVSFITGGISDLLLNLCFSKTGTVTLYNRKDQPICPTDAYSPLLLLPLGSDACGALPDTIKTLQNQASCPASAGCGVDTGTPAANTPASGNVNAASLAFFVSLICLLLKF